MFALHATTAVTCTRMQIAACPARLTLHTARQSPLDFSSCSIERSHAGVCHVAAPARGNSRFLYALAQVDGSFFASCVCFLFTARKRYCYSVVYDRYDAKEA